VHEGGVAAGGQGVGADRVVGWRGVACDRRRHFDLERLAVVVDLQVADEGRAGGLHAVLAQPGEQLRERAVHDGRHSVGHLASDSEVWQRFALLNLRCDHVLYDRAGGPDSSTVRSCGPYRAKTQDNRL
jgi:hypothetical protein